MIENSTVQSGSNHCHWGFSQMTMAIKKTPTDWTRSPESDKSTNDMDEGGSQIHVHAVDRVVRSLVMVVNVIMAVVMVVNMTVTMFVLVTLILLMVMIVLVVMIMLVTMIVLVIVIARRTFPWLLILLCLFILVGMVAISSVHMLLKSSFGPIFLLRSLLWLRTIHFVTAINLFFPLVMVMKLISIIVSLTLDVHRP